MYIHIQVNFDGSTDGSIASSKKIPPVLFMNGMSGRRGQQHLRRFYLEAMLPEERRHDVRTREVTLNRLSVSAGAGGALSPGSGIFHVYGAPTLYITCLQRATSTQRTNSCS
jgi:hypothetical protein